MLKYTLTCIFLLSHISAWGFDHAHSLWTKVLQKNLKHKGSQSLVLYQQLKQDHIIFDEYLKQLTKVEKEKYQKWSENQKLAFLINAYNAFTIKLIIDYYPVKSIKDIGSLFKSPWSKEFFQLLGQNMSLDNIEHQIIRKEFNEARIHFALNCASLGCPPLYKSAFQASKLESQLDYVTKKFLTNKDRSFIKEEEKKIYLNKIFDWYKEDFKKQAGSVEKFIIPYLEGSDKIKKEILMGRFRFKYLNYDWKLNDHK